MYKRPHGLYKSQVLPLVDLASPHQLRPPGTALPTAAAIAGPSMPRKKSVGSADKGVQYSLVFPHFHPADPETQKRVCKECGKELSSKSSTATLNRHLFKCSGGKIKALGTPKKRGNTLFIDNDSKQEIDQAVLEWVVDRFQSFRVTEAKPFKRMFRKQ